MSCKNRLIHAAAFAALTTSVAVVAQPQCYDFSGEVPKQRRTVGDSINARHATVTVRQAFNSGGAAYQAEARGAEAMTTMLAGGASPEMRLYLVAVQVQPNRPVSRVRMKVAQSIPPNANFDVATANIEINGERHSSSDGFRGLNGKRLGGAEMSSSLVGSGEHWRSGTLELRAKPGGDIKTFTVGAHTWAMDDLCFE